VTDALPFRSWVEDYVHDRNAMPPIDREAFRIRKIQRANTSRLMNGFASIRPTTLGQANRLRHEIAVSEIVKREAGRREAAEQPVELARLHLQRRGYIIVRANMFGGRSDQWSIAGRRERLTDDELIELAVRRGFNPVTTPKEKNCAR
jgi:hypothetical protein